MNPARIAAILSALCAGIAGGAALGGCGSQTQTVTAAGEPGAATAATTTATTATAPATATTQTTAAAPTTSTRTATEPAFTEAGSSSSAGAASAAAAIVREHGYTPNDTSEYHPDQTLEVLVGTRTGSGDGYGQQAFFFLDGRYLGTDTKEPSAGLKVLSQGDTEVTIAYPLYRHSDPLCCPGGGQAKVRFQLDNGRLVPLDPIPPANPANGLSRN